MSFRQIFGDDRSVEIPVIQRDYAQGRQDEHSQEVRRRFLEALGGALSTERQQETPLNLDFVYGRWRATEKLFEPLDGQQRLTTLFLLHWYAACLDGAFDEFQSWMVLPTGGSSFTYRTRPSAREFFDALVHQHAPLDALSASAVPLSIWVTDAVWFVRAWYRDPTVRGCLTMLDAIHARFSTLKGSWQQLVSTESPAIVVRLLLLDNFNLSDDLYVKMNARGKALTRFEIFKAEIERFVAEAFGAERFPSGSETGWREYISLRFDTAWTNFLWKHRSGAEVDSGFMHLIRSVAVVRCVERSDDTVLAGQIERLIGTPQPGLPFYEEIGCLDRPFVEMIVGVLDALSEHNGAPAFLGRTDYMKETDLFRHVLLARNANQDDGLTLVDWILFCAWCLFILRFPKDLANQTTREWFHDWTRIVANLTASSNIDRTDRLVGALRGLRQLAKSAGPDLLAKVAGGALDHVVGFNQQQQREERVKARLILRNSAWRQLLERAEVHLYFRGDIEFLLRFSGVFERVTKSEVSDWSDAEDVALRQSFTEWYERTCAIFPEDSSGGPRPFEDALWERALLATGDYLLPRGRNLSLLDARDRDASWKRLLRPDARAANGDARRDIVKRVLARVDPKEAETSLRAIVDAGVQGPDVALPGLRRCLVEDPRVIAYCGLRQLRIEDESAFLLTRVQRNGKHVDMFVYALYCRLDGRRGELTPFETLVCNSVKDTYYASHIHLGAPGFWLTATKPGHAIQLKLRITSPDPRIAARLTEWSPDGDALSRSVTSEAAEEKIVELAAALASLERLPTVQGPSVSES